MQSDSGIGIVGTIFYLAVIAVFIASFWMVFVKAGKPGWAAIIPIYNIIVLLQIVGRPLWWIILMLIPVVNLVVMIILYNDVSKAYGHGVGFTLGLILLSIIFWPILGFGGSKYVGRTATA